MLPHQQHDSKNQLRLITNLKRWMTCHCHSSFLHSRSPFVGWVIYSKNRLLIQVKSTSNSPVGFHFLSTQHNISSKSHNSTSMRRPVMTNNRLEEVDYVFHFWNALECSEMLWTQSTQFRTCNKEDGPVYCAMRSVRNLFKRSTQASSIPLLRVFEIMPLHKIRVEVMAILSTRNFSFAPIAKFHTLSSVVAAIPYQRVCEFVVYIAE